jgi:hypothetical protein
LRRQGFQVPPGAWTYPTGHRGHRHAHEHAGFNIHGATKVVTNDQQGRLALCKYILRPPLTNDRLTLVNDDHVRLDFKKPWSDGEGRGMPRGAGLGGQARIP